MIVLEDFLLKNVQIGSYALVKYNNKTIPVWFTRYNFGEGDWFLESPCSLYEIPIKKDINEFLIDMQENLEFKDEKQKDNYINNIIKPMIVNNIFYEIINFQCEPFLPIKVDYIKLINEKECLDFILNDLECKKKSGECM